MAVARLLLVVEDTFLIQGRGIVPVPGIIPIGSERFRIGGTLVLRRPDGTELTTRVGGLELFDPNPRGDVVVLLKDLSKEEIPIGTEVWSVDS